MKTSATLLTLAAAVAAAVPALAGPPTVHSDSASSERTWSAGSKAGTTPVTFVFQRTRPPASTRYVAYGECERSDMAGNTVGQNHLVFKNVRLTGVRSDEKAVLPKLQDDLFGGVHQFVLWELAGVMDRFADDDSILVSGKIQVKGQIAPDDVLACDLGMVEIDTGTLAREGGGDALEAFRRLAAAGRIPGLRSD